MYRKYIKRLLDFVLSLCALIVLSPLLLILTILGTIIMKGNPFFVQERPGLHERIIKVVNVWRETDNFLTLRGAALRKTDDKIFAFLMPLLDL